MNHLTVILKPTGRCNATCLYCSAGAPGAGEKGKNGFMSDETLDILFDRLDEWMGGWKAKKQVKIIWHGGEPLLMPVKFYQRAMDRERELEDKHGVGIENNIQSNLLALDDEKLAMLEQLLLFKGETRSVGTSFDPVAGIRIYKGNDYEKKWLEAIKRLQDKNIPFGIVYVVHRRTIEEYDGVTETFLERFPRVGVRFNPLYKEGRAMNTACEPLYITPLEWGDFLARLYGTWEAHDKKPSWQPLKELDIFHHNGGSRLSCDMVGRCGTTHLGIDTDGAVYCCGRGIDRKYKSFGNIHTVSMVEILRHPARRAMQNRAVYLENTRCGGCRWWRYCHGGCPMDAAINNNNDIFNQTNFCLSRKRYLENVYKEPVQ